MNNFSPINNENIFFGNDETDNEIELRGSLSSFITGDNRQIMRDSDLLSYDQVKIDAMQDNPLTIGLKRQIEINFDEDKFIILTALLPFNIIKKNSNEYLKNNISYEKIKMHFNNNEKYYIIPKMKIIYINLYLL